MELIIIGLFLGYYIFGFVICTKLSNFLNNRNRPYKSARNSLDYFRFVPILNHIWFCLMWNMVRDDFKD